MDTFTKTRGSNYITIRSRDLINTSNNGNGNSGRFVLFEAIEAGEDEVISVSLSSGTFPNSWYNLSATNLNNLLTFIENGTTYNTQIPDGNYNITELMAKIKNVMETANGGAVEYTFTYDEINNQVRIISNSQFITTMKFSLPNSPRRMLGFMEADINFNSFSPLLSNRAVDITDTQNSIYIRLPNLSNQKVIESSTGRYSNIIAHIPVLFSRNSFFTYEPSNPFHMELSQRTLSSIDVNITYQNEDIPVNFNRGDWEINIIVDFLKKPKSIARQINLHKNLINKYDIYKKKELDKEMRTQALKNLKSLKK
tara:strand:+ start:235 stop:1167 length:933 start_codon:yes stop_codon:yes gene_type:complete